MRKLIERSGERELFIYSEMPFSSTTKSKGKKNPRVDLAIVTLEKDNGTPAPVDFLAVIELKHCENHTNSIGINKDLDHLEALQKGIYYPYKPTRRLIPRRAYFLYLVDKGEISVDVSLHRKLELLKKTGYLKIFMGYVGKRRIYYPAMRINRDWTLLKELCAVRDV